MFFKVHNASHEPNVPKVKDQDLNSDSDPIPKPNTTDNSGPSDNLRKSFYE